MGRQTEMNVRDGMNETNRTLADGATSQHTLPDAPAKSVCKLLAVPAFTCESGQQLEHVEVAYETWGTLNATRDNVVVLCHALTGDTHAGDGGNRRGWWSMLVGPGKPIDTNRYFVVCSNVLGGCGGTTGPASVAPDGEVYGLRFPLVTVRDMVRLQIEWLNALGVQGIHTVIGGSLGGMQAWEWALLDAARVRRIVVIAAHAAFPPLAIGYNAAMRQAIVSDPEWHHGRYYQVGRVPKQGLALARTIGLLTYRANDLYAARFDRRGVTSERATETELDRAGDSAWKANHAAFTAPEFEVESYLAYNGSKFVARFDANSYLYLTKAMDGHDIGRGRKGLREALARIRSRLTVIAIDTDYLYETKDLARTAELAVAAGVQCNYQELTSAHGHDAFLVDSASFQAMIRQQFEGE